MAFVDDFPTSSTREPIHDGWTRHRETLDALMSVEHQWIGGSYVTSKTDPNDIDVCTFIDGPAFDAIPEPQRIAGTAALGSPSWKKRWRCDAYTLVRYPIDHPEYARFEAAHKYWANLWSSSRPDESGHSTVRGYVVV